MDTASATPINERDTHTTHEYVDTLAKAPLDPIDTKTLTLFSKIAVGFWLFVSSMGICNNAINVHTFVRMKLDDSVTISFFAMAITDFSNCSLAFAQSIGSVCELLERDFRIYFQLPPFVVCLFMEFVRKIFSSMTALITTYVAVQRCLCVVAPFRVRGMFTNFKTYCFLAVSFSFLATSFGLLIWQHEVIEIPSSVFNASQKALFVLRGSEPYFFIADVIIGVILNLGCQFIVIICLVVMFVVLKRSLRFRQELTASTEKDIKSSGQENANAKEIQALKQVALISFIFVCTNCPYFGLGMGRLFVPGFGMKLAYGNIFQLTILIMYSTEQLNAAVNFFVYYNFNAKFRQMCILALKK